MPVFPFDQPVRLTFKTYSDAAETTLADPTTLALTVLKPDGTTDSFTWTGAIARDSLGVFHYDFTPAAAGHYEAHWKATGTVATSGDSEFDVDPQYTYGLVSVDDFGVYLNNPDLDRVRARSILDRAQRLCESIVKPLPAGAEDVVIDVAQRAFANPVSVGGATAYYAEGEGPFSDTTPGSSGGGLYLTQNNIATLRRLNGSGGAFSIDTCPSTAGLNLPWWDTGSTFASGDWDVPA